MLLKPEMVSLQPQSPAKQPVEGPRPPRHDVGQFGNLEELLQTGSFSLHLASSLPEENSLTSADVSCTQSLRSRSLVVAIKTCSLLELILGNRNFMVTKSMYKKCNPSSPQSP